MVAAGCGDPSGVCELDHEATRPPQDWPMSCFLAGRLGREISTMFRIRRRTGGRHRSASSTRGEGAIHGIHEGIRPMALITSTAGTRLPLSIMSGTHARACRSGKVAGRTGDARAD